MNQKKLKQIQQAPPQYAKPNIIQRKQIDKYSYLLSNQIGRGYSSIVFRGKDDRTNDENLAIKVIDTKLMTNEVQLFLLGNEINVLRRLQQTQNPNILKLHDIFQTQNNTYIITELCNQGDVKELLKQYNHLSEVQAFKILSHIFNGYKALVDNKIVHRDIKPANILIKDGVFKIADFGFGKFIDDPPYKYYYSVGTPMYMSPQSLLKNEYDVKSDIWSIGILYYELLYGCTPWIAESEQDLKYKICNIPVQFPNNGIYISNESKDFIKGCLQIDYTLRFGIEEIENHILFATQNKTCVITIDDDNTCQQNSQQIFSYSQNSNNDKSVEIIENSNNNLEYQFLEQIQQNNHIILAQINYCRFLYRLHKILMESQILESPFLKEKLAYLMLKNILIKIKKLNNLSDNQINQLNLSEWNFYINTESYQRFSIIIGEYILKYSQTYNEFTETYKDILQDILYDNNLIEFENFYVLQDKYLRATIREINHLIKLKIVYFFQNNNNIEDNQQNLPQEIEKDVVLLDYLVVLFQLTQIIIENFNNYAYFAEKSLIEQFVDGRNIQINKIHYNQIRNKIYELDI
ncbi:protein kinase domain protein [Ichthyophthirius multifiliis]|uniref:Protein kinase domain protein n=1 Tax=Ichthyophthirius multifiliis TaxID=5932 RepID=G0QXG5_ICHMU|nr:protein kinase domain protein [Ichthyophthirius multifiliis]EGR30083.1 protein kinase domain protein [Ichthyophthirius multifiliis]|eukprot:XP_004031319.1 protein kinase domain protein [Ichthyophthirius multifiliis]